jgi:hypothetical protein
MWQIEQEHYDGGRVRWTPVKGERYVDRGAADAALGVVVRRGHCPRRRRGLPSA